MLDLDSSQRTEAYLIDCVMRNKKTDCCRNAAVDKTKTSLRCISVRQLTCMACLFRFRVQSNLVDVRAEFVKLPAGSTSSKNPIRESAAHRTRRPRSGAIEGLELAAAVASRSFPDKTFAEFQVFCIRSPEAKPGVKPRGLSLTGLTSLARLFSLAHRKARQTRTTRR